MKELGTKIWYVWVFFCQTVCFNLMNRNNFLFCFLGYRREKRPTHREKYLLCWNTNDEECCTCIENIPGYNIFALFMLRMLTKKITWFQWGARPSCPSVGHIFREWSIAFLLWRMAPKEKEKKRYRYKSVIDRLVVSCILICNAFINSLSTCNTRPTVIAFLALPISTDFRTRAKRPVKRFPWKK